MSENRMSPYRTLRWYARRNRRHPPTMRRQRKSDWRSEEELGDYAVGAFCFSRTIS
jgi:hypothetical protein